MTRDLRDGLRSSSLFRARAAYYRLGKVWHSACLPPALEDVRSEASGSARPMTETYTRLTAPHAHGLSRKHR